jgi:hypothetical protein
MIAALLGAAVMGAHVQGDWALPQAQREAVLDALFMANLTEPDVRANPPLREGNPLAAELHAAPIRHLAALARELLDRPAGPVLPWLAERALGISASPLSPVPPAIVELPAELPPGMAEPLSRLVRECLAATEEVRRALQGLDADERRSLLESLPRHSAPASRLPLDFVTRPPLAWAEVRSLAARVDLSRIAAAAIRLEQAAEREIAALSAMAPPSFRSRLRFLVQGLPVVVAGFGDDVHPDRDAILIVDCGGDDRYTGRPGAGVGYASVLLDLGGNDRYELPDLALGAGLLGIGLAWDIGGADVVSGRSLCLGAGVAGVGQFVSRGSIAAAGGFSPGLASRYESAAMSQGFGLFGMGAMRDEGGDDVYRASYLAQGAALSEGAGWLEDRQGADEYACPGLAPTLESDEPTRARAQGFGGKIDPGPEERAGVGVLRDLAGRDRYLAGAEALGCGVDGGVGAVAEAEGDDEASTLGYAFGFGARSGAGLWADEKGDDLRVSAWGASHGRGVESGLGLLLDGAGSDTNVSAGGSGEGSLGGIGLHFDFAGSDRHLFAAAGPAQSLAEMGFGVFLDAAGANRFEGFATPDVRRSLAAIAAQLAARTPLAPSPEEAAATGSLLTVGQVEAALADASGRNPFAARTERREARRSLLRSELATMAWLLEQSRPLDASEIAVLAEVTRSVTPADRALVLRRGETAPPPALVNLFTVVSWAGWKESENLVLASLGKDAAAPAAARAAARLGLSVAVDELLAKAASRETALARAAAVALAQIGGPETQATAQAFLHSDDPVVRLAGIAFYERVRPASLGTLRNLLDASAEPQARAAMRALSAIGTEDALEEAAARLEDRRAGLRIEALWALDGRCPPRFQARFDALREDRDARVRAVARSVSTGR